MQSYRSELQRKSLHLASAVFAVAYAAGAPRNAIVLLLALGAVAALGIEMARAAHDPTRRLFGSVVGTLLRPHELERWTGATWLALALLIAAAAYPRDVAIAAMWSVSVGDAAAAIAGRALQSRRVEVASKGKSVVGSAVCFALSSAGAMMLAELGVGESVAVGLLAAAAERPRGPLDDNVRIVLAVGGGILLWRIALS